MVDYPVVLAILSGVVFGCERLWPRVSGQKAIRPHLVSDLAHLVFNGHFLGVILYTWASRWVAPGFDRGLRQLEWYEAVYRNAAADWPLWVQIPVVLVVADAMQWGIHRLLHAVPWLWELHKVHHSVPEGEMDFWVSFRFHWGEVVVYRVLQFLPLAWFGFAVEAMWVQAVVGTLVGHLNHSNLDLGYGPWRYVLNSPRMHLWHHDRERGANAVNFGIVFSAWDWLFGTAYVPEHPPRRLGFQGDEEFPRTFFAQEAWPLGRVIPARWAAGMAVVGIAAAWWLH